MARYDREIYRRRPYEDMDTYRRLYFEAKQENDKLKKRIRELETLTNSLIPNLDEIDWRCR